MWCKRTGHDGVKQYTLPLLWSSESHFPSLTPRKRVKVSLNLFKMARAGLELELRTAISKARKSGLPVKTVGVHIRVPYPSLRVKQEEERRDHLKN